jgi:hypothetical protein
MYVPHQYGVVLPSDRDVHTLQWLYRLPIAFSYKSQGGVFGLAAPFQLQDVLDILSGDTPRPTATTLHDNPTTHSATGTASPPSPTAGNTPEVLNYHHNLLSQQGLFHVATQHVAVPKELKEKFLQAKQLKKPLPKPPEESPE